TGRREPDHRADRQVDATREDDEGHPHRAQAEEGVVGEEVGEHTQREERPVLESSQAKDRHEDTQGGKERHVPAAHAELHRVALPGTSAPSCLRNSPDCRRMTITTTAALTTSVNWTGTPLVKMVVVRLWMMSAPTSEPSRLNFPPSMLVPPITTARLPSNSMYVPTSAASEPWMLA